METGGRGWCDRMAANFQALYRLRDMLNHELPR